MRVVHIAFALMLSVVSLAKAHAAEAQAKFVEYQGERFALPKAYRDFHEYKNGQANLTPAQVQRIESLMRSAKFGPRFKTSEDLDAALSTLEFPGYGLFYANQLGAHIDPKLELAYVEVPGRSLNRYVAVERQADGSLLVVADFVAAAEPEITRVTRGADGALEFHQQNGSVVVVARR